METNHQESAGQPGQKNWSKRIVIGGLAVAALAGVGVAGALSQDFGPQRMLGLGMGPHQGMQMGMGAEHASFRGGFGEHRMERILEEIDATPEQTEKLKAIMDKVQDEVFPLAKDFRNTRDDVAELLGAASIDRAAAEKLRAERIAAIDEASRKVTTALLDAAEVLTPEQRTELARHFEARSWHRRW